MLADPAVPFVVEFSRTARVIEYRDSSGSLEFSFDVPSGEGKTVLLEHHPVQWRRDPRYDVAFERSTHYLESCGYHVGAFEAPRRASPISAQELCHLIDTELSGKEGLASRPVDLLALPRREVFVNDTDKSEWDLWLVLDSRGSGHRGLKIVYDDQSQQFGLASAANIFLGFWGSFVPTYTAFDVSAHSGS